MRALIVGASTGVGRALAEALAREGARLHLVASDRRDLEALAADLSLRRGAAVTFTAADLAELDPAALREECLAALGGLDALFYIAGVSFIERDPQDLTDDDARRLVAVNFASAARLINSFAPLIETAPRFDLVGVGSVAQARPRGRNTLYAASKAALEFYFEGLRHRWSGTGRVVRFYRAGFVDTAMTWGQRTALPKASPESVASAIVAGLGREGAPAHAPRWWGLVALVYRSIPWPIFRRMGRGA